MLADMVMPSRSSRSAEAAVVAGATGWAASRERDDACPGALRLHQADDGGLARVRVPGGVLGSGQAAALGAAAVQLGDGDLHLTSRGNLQLRGLGEDSGAELARLLDGAGLLPSLAHERVRNIVASPLSGLDGCGYRDVRPWLAELDRLLCGSEEARGLSGRFLFAVDDGRGDVAALGADVTLVAVREGGALLRVGADRDAGALRIDSAYAATAAVTAAEVFLETARECGVRAWRVSELPMTGGELAHRLEHRLAHRLPPRLAPRLAHRVAQLPGDDERPTDTERLADAQRLGDAERIVPISPVPELDDQAPAPGLVTSPTGQVALSVHAPLGRLTSRQWALLARTAERHGSGELRLTPWRGVVVPGLAPERAPGALAALGDAGLVTDPASPWRGVGACAGRPGCAKSLTDVRDDAAAALASSPQGAAALTNGSPQGAAGPSTPQGEDGAKTLPVYWSGCERRCGHPRGDRVEVVAGPGGYQVSVVRSSGAVVRVPLPHRSALTATVSAARNSASGPGPTPTPAASPTKATATTTAP
ncbi:precorrin-3B synthase [Streptomyces sp. CA-250714]|uniref:precorrin-3B synthase n=1 Tax=Streptomyces sp. CA-250714 TaxID=3240060 RepID=UPI003D93A393